MYQEVSRSKKLMELREVFASLADGIEEEERLTQQKAPKSDIDKNWLPGQEIARTFVAALLAA